MRGAIAILALAAAISVGCTRPAQPLPAQSPSRGAESAEKLDLYGDPLPRGAICRFGAVRFDVSRDYNDAVFLPDGTKVLLMRKYDSSCNGIGICDMKTGRMTGVIKGCGRHCAFSADGRTLAALSRESCRLLDPATCEDVCDPLPVGASRLAWRPDGKAIAFDTGTVWSFPGGERIGTFARCSRLAFSPDGSRLAAMITRDANGHDQHSVRLYDTVNWRILWDTPAPAGAGPGGDRSRYSDVAFSPDGKYALAAARIPNNRNDNPVYQWHTRLVYLDARNGDQTRAFELGQSSSSGLFSGDGRFFAYEEFLPGVPRWFRATRLLALEACPTGPPRPIRIGDNFPHRSSDVAFSADGRILANLADGRCSFWDTSAGRVLHPEFSPRKLFYARFLPDGRRALTVDLRGKVSIWDATTGRDVASFVIAGREDEENTGRQPRFCRLSPDGRLLAVLTWSRGAEVWDVRECKLAWRCEPADPNRIKQLLFSPDGGTLTVYRSYSTEKCTRWRADTGQALPPGSPTASQPAPANRQLLWWADADHGLLAYYQDSGKYDIVDAQTGLLVCRAPIMGTVSPTGDMMINPDASQPCPTETWTGLPLRALDFDFRGIHNSTRPAYSADCMVVALASSKDVHIMDLTTGRMLKVLPFANIRSMDLAPDRRLLTAGSNGICMVWDLSDIDWPSLPRPAGTDRASMEALWRDLGSASAATAQDACLRLAGAGAPAVGFIMEQVRSDPAERRLAEAIRQLNDDEWKTRNQATQTLREAGPAARAMLLALLAQPNASLEQRVRAEIILEAIQAAPPLPVSLDTVRLLRATTALERIGGAAAAKGLDQLADQPHQPPVNTVARLARHRLRAHGRDK